MKRALLISINTYKKELVHEYSPEVSGQAIRTFIINFVIIKHISLLVLVMAAMTMFSQPYTALPRNNAQWIVKWDDIHGDEGTHTLKKLMYYTSGDTTINDTIFTKLKDNYNSTLGYLFQSKNNERLYFIEDYGFLTFPKRTNSIILMDLNLNVGDTFQNWFLSNSWNAAIVEKIDTIPVNGQMRKRIVFGNEIMSKGHFEKYSFIEGVGPNAGLLPQQYLGLIVSMVSCFKENGVTMYPENIEDFGCYMFTSAPSEYQHKNTSIPVNISPNPFSNTLTITPHLNTIAPSNLKIINILGQLVYESTLELRQPVELNIDNIPPGTYYAIFSSNNIKIFSAAIIKQ
jgi:hypothetical protein